MHFLSKAPRKCLSTLLVFVMVLTMALAATPVTAFAAEIPVTLGVSGTTDSVGAIQTAIQTAIDGASSGDVVVVDGAFTGAWSLLALDIKDGVTVAWGAVYGGTSGHPENYSLIELSGAGTFSVTAGGSITAQNSFDTIYSAGTTTIEVNGGTVEANGSGAGERGIEATGNVVVNGGVVTSNRSLAISSRGTVSVGGGGAVSTTGGGFAAIVAPTVLVSGEGTSVTATDSAAISSNWCRFGYLEVTRVEVSGGTVEVNGTNNAAAILCKDTVIVSGGTVRSNTLGNAISFYGTNSSATVSGGLVEATGDGGRAIASQNAGTTVAVSGGIVRCTGATNTGTGAMPFAIVLFGANGKVTVSDDALVEATGPDSDAIRTRGADSTVTVNGGTVHSAAGRAIYAGQTGNAVNVNGGTVSTAGGMAIQLDAANSSATVEGGMVIATTGIAIRGSATGATATVNGGFVFAYGSKIPGADAADTDCVINMEGGVPFTGPTGSGVVVAWDHDTWAANGSLPYMLGTGDDITVSAGATAVWDRRGARSGIAYANGTNEGLYELAAVTVNVSESDYGLIFDAGTGKFYLDLNNNQTFDPDDIEYTGQSAAWSWAGNTLTLDGFVWNTTAPNALVLSGSGMTLAVNGTNTFAVTGEQVTITNGILVSGTGALTITGGGTLNATGGNIDPAQSDVISTGISGDSLTIQDAAVNVTGGTGTGDTRSFGLNVANNFTFIGGTISAIGNTSAINAATIDIAASAYRFWTNTLADHPGGDGQRHPGADYVWDANQKYVRLALDTTPYYNLTVRAGAGGSVSGTPSGSYAQGETISVTATANAGYHFTGWTITGASIAGGNDANPATFGMPGGDVTLTANFAAGPPTAASPQTGDGGNMALQMILLLASGLGIAGTAFRKVKIKH